MNQTEYSETAKKSSFTDSLAAVPATISAKLPSMDRSLDRYFDAHMSAIINEWGLITQHHLDDFDHRLERVSLEIRSLEKGRTQLEKRAADLDSAIRDLEVK